MKKNGDSKNGMSPQENSVDQYSKNMCTIQISLA